MLAKLIIYLIFYQLNMNHLTKKLVGFRPVSDWAQQYVNDLPGISAELGTALVEDEDIDCWDAEAGLTALWERISMLAYEKLLLDLEVLLSEKGAFRHELAYTSHLPVGTTVLAANTQRTLRIKTQPVRFTRLVVDSLAVVANGEGMLSVELTDGNGAALMEVVTYNLYAGLNELDFFYEAPNSRGVELRLAVRATVGLTAFRGKTLTESGQCMAEALSVWDEVLDQVAEDPVLDAGLRLGGHLDALVERNATLLAPAYQYVCGHQFMLEKLASNNFNAFTNTNRLVTEDNRDAYHKQYRTFLTRAAALMVKQLENSPTLEATAHETGGWSLGSLV
ncbi:hypothetical protein [Salmonirosea aquatica]|uniref:Uncharacterized protein n=1 Tax=Salmonirosea aquatica TaxID=2654236 RepID=A0A7C9BJE8_9BACT|nr:hypothetical protein [Cytophagaceae bacterium SJW1-29]